MQSFLGWIGGKSALRNAILNRFPDKVGRYIEVFGGAGWVLFGRDPVPGQMEVFNDADGELIKYFTAASNTIRKPFKKSWMGCLIRGRSSSTMPHKNIFEE